MEVPSRFLPEILLEILLEILQIILTDTDLGILFEVPLEIPQSSDPMILPRVILEYLISNSSFEDSSRSSSRFFRALALLWIIFF